MKFKCLLVIVVSSIAFTSSNAFAQNLSGDDACKQVVPQMLTFVDSIADIPVAFDQVYDKFSAGDKAKFAQARNTGYELEKISKEYRAAFLKACYGN